MPSRWALTAGSAISGCGALPPGSAGRGRAGTRSRRRLRPNEWRRASGCGRPPPRRAPCHAARPGPARPNSARPPRRALAAPHARHTAPPSAEPAPPGKRRARTPGGGRGTRGTGHCPPPGRTQLRCGPASPAESRGWNPHPALTVLHLPRVRGTSLGQQPKHAPRKGQQQPKGGGGVTPLMFSSTDHAFTFQYALVWKGATQPPSSLFIISQNQTRALMAVLTHHYQIQAISTAITAAAEEAAKPAPKLSVGPGCSPARANEASASSGHQHQPLPQPCCLLSTSRFVQLFAHYSPFPC